MKYWLICLLTAVPLSAGQKTRSFIGTITDDICAKAGHASMQMGPNDTECTKACVISHGAHYVLQNEKSVYSLTDQTTPEKFAGQRVRIVGTLDPKTNTIRVESMTADDSGGTKRTSPSGPAE